MPVKFDTPTCWVQSRTKETARTLFQKTVAGTECLLISLLEQYDQTSEVLQANGLEIGHTTRRAITFIGVHSGQALKFEDISCSVAVDNVFSQAQMIAKNCKDNHVTTVHVAIALIRNDTAVVGKLLKELNVDPEKLVNDLSCLKKAEPAVSQAEIDDLMIEALGVLARVTDV